MKIENDGGSYSDGGNYLSDGHGRLFCDSFGNKSYINKLYSDFFGFQEICHLPQYRVHLDYYMKMVNEETIFISEIPKSNYSDDIPPSADDSLFLENAVNHIQDNYLSCYGRPFNIVRIKNRPTLNITSKNLTVITEDASYTNALILNNSVLVPTYDCYETDNAALETYKKYMPGYNIVPIPSNYFSMAGGAVHCLTKEIGADNPIGISHKWIKDTLKVSDNYKIEAEISSFEILSSVTLFWSLNPDKGYNSISMTNSKTNLYSAHIPKQPDGTRIHYYIEATSHIGKSIRKPYVAPKYAYNFVVNSSGITGNLYSEKDIPDEFALYNNYPNPFNPATNISFSLPKESFVDLTIYNSIGQKILTLVNKRLSAGKHSYLFDAGNLSSGMYIYRINAGNKSITKKMSLIK